MALAGMCSGILLTTLYVLATDIYPASVRSFGVGMCFGASRIGGIVGVLSGGVLLTIGSTSLLFFIAAVAALTVSAFGFLLISPHIAKSTAVSAAHG